jgi:UDPglucose--hexose-1-phosphate uridylyltransferase
VLTFLGKIAFNCTGPVSTNTLPAAQANLMSRANTDTGPAENFSLSENSHRRYNPLLDDWVLVSPQRNKRPWLGQAEANAPPNANSYDASCYLCPGNTRINGALNPHYTSTLVFNNDFPAVESSPQFHEDSSGPLFKTQSASGCARVLCFSPDHSKTLPLLDKIEIRSVIECWASQVEELSSAYPWVQVFENKGAAMGCSNPHPHGQIWATPHIPSLVSREDQNLKNYYAVQRSNLLLDYAQQELVVRERVVDANDHWVALVPYWATWPFEILLIPLIPTLHLNALSAEQKNALSDILLNFLTRYDNLFQCSFPYSMGWHGRIFDTQPAEHWQLHAHFYPPLLRSATVKKFMVGYEMLAEAQRDITPEQAAELLRAQSTTHYTR